MSENQAFLTIGEVLSLDPNEIFPGVHFSTPNGPFWEDIPPDDPAYFKYHIDPETPKAFDWERDEIKSIFQALFPPKPYKKYRPQKRRMCIVSWVIPSKHELVFKDVKQLNTVPMTMDDWNTPVILESERVDTPAQPMAWSNWQYELEQWPEGLPELARDQGWINV